MTGEKQEPDKSSKQSKQTNPIPLYQKGGRQKNGGHGESISGTKEEGARAKEAKKKTNTKEPKPQRCFLYVSMVNNNNGKK